MSTVQYSPQSLAVMKALAHAIKNRVPLLQWWKTEISSLPPESRRLLLLELAELFAANIKVIDKIAQALGVDKAEHPQEFRSILFDFLLPLHGLLVKVGNWDQALGLELIIASTFIKQDEDYKFYEESFSRLYEPYLKILNAPADTALQRAHHQSDSIKTPLENRLPANGATLFWFQNFSILAHTQLVLDLASNLSGHARFFASALTNVNLEVSRSTFEQAKIELLPIDEQQGLASRCKQLVNVCKSNNIKNIVFVSLPLQSGFLRTICNDIGLTWWSMKYPLGCMPQFDRLVCNRALEPHLKLFNGALWNCAPFAVKPLAAVKQTLSQTSDARDLTMGVLSREEKFASSDLPELIHRCLIAVPNTRLFWTGRKKPYDLNRRLHGPTTDLLEGRIQFCGWVDPSVFLSQIDVLIDTPNLGGMVAYWMMSMGKVVISATDSGSVGALGSPEELSPFFELLATREDVEHYFASNSKRPFYLKSADLIPLCIEKYAMQHDLLKVHGDRFLGFFNNDLSDMERWSRITYKMLQGVDNN